MKNKKIKIIVVDDEPHITNLIYLSFDKNKYEVIRLYSARECLRYIEKNDSPDIFIIDLIMPIIDGFELCEKLRIKKETSQTPIIILSAKGHVNDKINAIDVGADDYITKPFDPNEVELRVKRNLKLD